MFPFIVCVGMLRESPAAQETQSTVAALLHLSGARFVLFTSIHAVTQLHDTVRNMLLMDADTLT